MHKYRTQIAAHADPWQHSIISLIWVIAF